jgi:hypothetical protein
MLREGGRFRTQVGRYGDGTITVTEQKDCIHCTTTKDAIFIHNSSALGIVSLPLLNLYNPKINGYWQEKRNFISL